MLRPWLIFEVSLRVLIEAFLVAWEQKRHSLHPSPFLLNSCNMGRAPVLRQTEVSCMGSRDYRRRERKKPKKDTKKVTGVSILPPTETVGVVKKAKKERRGQEE